MKKILVIANFLLVIFSCNKGDSGPAPDKASEQKTVNLTIDGNARSFIIYLPAGYNNLRMTMRSIGNPVKSWVLFCFCVRFCVRFA